MVTNYAANQPMVGRPASAGRADSRDSTDIARWDALRGALDRLSSDVAEALVDGTWAVPEAARLHAWVKSELIPWSTCPEATPVAADPAALAQITSDRGLLTGLNSLLSGSRGHDAGQWAREIQVTGHHLIDQIESLCG